MILNTKIRKTLKYSAIFSLLQLFNAAAFGMQEPLNAIEANTVINVLLAMEGIKCNLKMHWLASEMGSRIGKKYPFPIGEDGVAKISPTLEQFAALRQYRPYFSNEGDKENIPNIVLNLYAKKNPEITILSKFLYIIYEVEQVRKQKTNMLNKIFEDIVLAQYFLKKITSQDLRNTLTPFFNNVCTLIGLDNFMQKDQPEEKKIAVNHPAPRAIKLFLDEHPTTDEVKTYYKNLVAKYPQKKKPSIIPTPKELEPLKGNIVMYETPQTFEDFISNHEKLGIFQTKINKPTPKKSQEKKIAHKKIVKINEKTSKHPSKKKTVSGLEPLTIPSNPSIAADMLNTNFKETQDGSYAISASDLVIEFGYRAIEGFTDRIICLRPDAWKIASLLAFHERVKNKKEAFINGARDEDTVLHAIPECLARMKQQCIKNIYRDANNRDIENWVFFGEKNIGQETIPGMYVLGFLPNTKKPKMCYHAFFVPKNLDDIKSCSDTEILSPLEKNQLEEGLSLLQKKN